MASTVKVVEGRNYTDVISSFSATGRRIKAALGDFVTVLHSGIQLFTFVLLAFFISYT